jgi:DNA-binding response OmpR family regulator
MKHLILRHRVLLVAGELDLRARFARELQSSGYAVELASDMKRALTLAADDHFRVAIVAPGPSLATVPALRDTVPKMIVVAEGPDEIARLRRSLSGVDDFILKSASEGALAAAVSEMIALADGAAGKRVSFPRIGYIGDGKLDLGGNVFVTPNGREVVLTRAESDLLTALVRSPRQVVSRDKLRYAVAGRGMDPFDRSVDMLVARVRRKIEPDPKVPRFLLTVPGVGYKLITRTQPAKARQLEAEQIATVKPEEIQAFFGWPKADEENTERAVTAFASLDSDGDGLISLQEFQAVYERIFNAMDTDKDGSLTLEEIQDFMATFCVVSETWNAPPLIDFPLGAHGKQAHLARSPSPPARSSQRGFMSPGVNMKIMSAWRKKTN